MSFFKVTVLSMILGLSFFSANSMASHWGEMEQDDKVFIDILMKCPDELNELSSKQYLSLSKAKYVGGMTADLAISTTYRFEFIQLYPAPLFDEVAWALEVVEKREQIQNNAPDAPGMTITYTCSLDKVSNVE